MRLRQLFLVIVLVGGFWLLTTHPPDFTRLSLTNVDGRSSGLHLTEAQAAPEYDAEEQNNIAVYKRVLPSVVNITARALVINFFYGAVPQEGQGSGFVLDREGHVLTNYHVVAGANRGIQVTLSNKHSYSARVVGSDKVHDLALLQIDAPNLQPVTLADSSQLSVGQKVYAIGNPFGLSGTLTRGIVSSIRSVQEPDGMTIDEAIQTDAAINPGNSGGPLLNWHGEVIGINTMIASNVGQSAGIGFAIPINTAKAVLNDLMTLGRVRRPALGVRTIPIDSDLAEQMGLSVDYGLLIVQVVQGGAAERAGLRGGSERAYLGNVPITLGGDVIVAIDDEKVEDQQTLAQIMNKHRAGDTIRITIYRGKKKMDVNVSLGEAREQV